MKGYRMTAWALASAASIVFAARTVDAQGPSVSTWFDPGIHGWPFENKTFALCLLATCDEWGNFRNLVVQHWALCGGMSLTALRRFVDRDPVEPLSEEVKLELGNGQLETLGETDMEFGPFGRGMIDKIADWQSSPDSPSRWLPHTIGHLTKQEWPNIKASLDLGAPIILVVIREGPSIDPRLLSKNHQVLAIGYREDGHKKEIIAYDPNHPREVVTFRVNFGLADSQIDAKQSTGERVRGFFVNYLGSSRPSAPPGSLLLPVVAALR